MSTEHAWLPGMISSLDAGLAAADFTGRYALIGFGNGFGGGQNLGRKILVGAVTSAPQPTSELLLLRWSLSEELRIATQL